MPAIWNVRLQKYYCHHYFPKSIFRCFINGFINNIDNSSTHTFSIALKQIDLKCLTYRHKHQYYRHIIYKSRLPLNVRNLKYPLVGNITGITLFQIFFIFCQFLLMDILVNLIISCTQYTGFEIIFPVFGYNFLCDRC